MIRAILKKGKIQLLDELPENWHDGQELIIEGFEHSDNPADIKCWYEKLLALSAQIPVKDQQRVVASVKARKPEAKN